jgi:UDP-glucose 4-epimerase
VNVEGFVNTVDQARRDGCSTVVYASRSSLYESQAAPTSEDETVRAATAYQASKLAREQYGEYFVNHYDLNAAGMRIFSAYQGYAESADHEEEYANVVGQFADDLAHGRSPAVYGEGTQTRDFIHVEDIVRGLIAAADHRLDGLYNLGTGRSVSFEELIEMLADELGTDADPEYIESPIPKAACVDDARADISKIRSETEWTPEVSLEEGLARVCSQYGAPKP